MQEPRSVTTSFRRGAAVLLVAVAAATRIAAQDTLTLDAAVGRALERNASLMAAVAASDAGEAESDAARAALLPRVDFTESFRRSDNPVFAFGSLLNQGRFTEENFALDRLNRPEPLSLYQSQIRLRQVIFDREVFLSRERAELSAELGRESRRQTEMETIFATVRAYHGIQVAVRNTSVLEQALEAAQSDLERSEALYEAGQVTEADLLALRVQVADLTDQSVRARNAVELVRAELNQLMGEDLDQSFELTTTLPEVDVAERAHRQTDLERTAMEKSPMARQSELQEDMARVSGELAEASFFPSVRFDAAWESDRVSFTGGGGTNWMLGVAVDVNLFDGLGRLAGLRAADAERRRAAAARRAAVEALRLEIRRARLDRESSLESMEVARRSVAQARESHRITQARYEAGLANVTGLLRSQQALLDAEARHLRAIYEARMAAVRLALVTGTLDRDSEVLTP